MPTNPKWQIGPFLWQKVARRETERSAASAKRAATTHRGIPKGAALGAPLVTFPATGKSPGCRAWQSHALAERLQVGAGTAVPQKPPGRGAERPLMGRSAEEGTSPPHMREKPRAAHPLRKSRSFIKIYNLFISLLHLCYIMKRTKELS